MSALCAYLGAMAGVTALCYIFRKRPEQMNAQGSSTDENNKEAAALPQTPIASIVVTPPVAEKNKTRGRGPLSPESQAKIQEVLDFVNTPSDELVLVKEEILPEVQIPPLQLPVYNCEHTKKPKEVMNELQQSKAKVEAWMSELDKVINNEGAPPSNDLHDQRSEESAHNKSALITVNSEPRKSPNNDRLAKVKEEIAKRRVVVNTRVDAAKKRETEREDENPSARRKRSTTPDVQGGTSFKRETIEVPSKRPQENARKRPAASATPKQVSSSSADTTEDQRTPRNPAARKEEPPVAKPGPSNSRSPVRRPPASQKREDTTSEDHAKTRPRRPAPVKVELQRTKTQSKPTSSFEVRMKYIPPSRQTQTPSPTQLSEEKTRPPVASKIPVLISSRARPPAAQATKQKPAPAVTHKPKKSIRITNEPPPPPRPSNQRSGAAITTPKRHFSHVVQDEKSGKSSHTMQDEKSSHTMQDEKTRKSSHTMQDEKKGMSSHKMQDYKTGKSSHTMSDEKKENSSHTMQDEKTGKSSHTMQDEKTGKSSLTMLDEKKEKSSHAMQDEQRGNSSHMVQDERRENSSHTMQDERREKSYDAVQDEQSNKSYHEMQDEPPVHVADEDTQPRESYPELNIIGVSSFHPEETEEVASHELVARVAKSGPINVVREDSVSRVRSQSISSLRSRGPPLSVSKTVQLPDGLEENVTVYFSLTVPRCANANLNWNGHNDSDTTITIGNDDEVNPASSDPEAEEGGGSSDNGYDNDSSSE